MFDELTRLRRANAVMREALEEYFNDCACAESEVEWLDAKGVWYYKTVPTAFDQRCSACRKALLVLPQADAIMHQPETSPNQPDVGFFSEQFGSPNKETKE